MAIIIAANVIAENFSWLVIFYIVLRSCARWRLLYVLALLLDNIESLEPLDDEDGLWKKTLADWMNGQYRSQSATLGKAGLNLKM